MQFSKPRETSALLVCLGIVLLFPPIALIFGKSAYLFDIPLPVFYIFGIWLMLIIIARLLAKKLSDDSE